MFFRGEKNLVSISRKKKVKKEKKIISTEKQKKNVRCGAVAKYRNAAAAQL
jgi:hypothetical protein